MSWTDTQVTELRKLWSEPHTAAQIGRKLEKRGDRQGLSSGPATQKGGAAKRPAACGDQSGAVDAAQLRLANRRSDQ